MKNHFIILISTFLFLFLINNIYASDRDSLYQELLKKKLSKTAVDDYTHYHNVGNLGLTVTNYGLLGNGYLTALKEQPSCQYKYQSNLDKEKVEHFSYAGLWVGGIGGVNGEEEPLVSTAIIDGVFEYGEAGFEFTNTADAGDVVKERSSIVTSSLFDPSAISHQDFICDFTDKNLRVPGTEIDLIDHVPLGLDVHFESYSWNYSYADAFVILNYTFKNISDYTIKDVYAGLWVDPSVANMNYTSIYEPGGGFSWYDNLNGFDKDYKMGYQFDFDGDNGFAESYFGLRVLGSSVPESNYKVFYDQWQWTSTADPDFFMPSTDAERYAKLSSTPAASIPKADLDQASWIMLVSLGSMGDLAPGDSVNAVFAIVCGFWANEGGDSPARRENLRVNSEWAQIAYNGEDVDGDGKLDPNEDQNHNGILDGDEDVYRIDLDLNGNGKWDLGESVFGDEDGHLDIFEDSYQNFQRGIQDSNGVIDRYILPSPPPSPNLKVVPGNGQIALYWDNFPEDYRDPITREKDFEGYRVYSAPKTHQSQSDATLLAQFDEDDSLALGYNTGFKAIQFDTILDGKQYNYRFIDDKLTNGWPGQYYYSVTSFDKGNPENNLASMESSINENITYAIPGATVTEKKEDKIYVYPNPYKVNALWDGSGPRDRLIWFANLPPKATIRIYSLAGDLIDEIKHNADSYTGTDAAILSGSSHSTEFSGGEHGWDLISRHDQAIATGLYLYSVKNEKTGDVKTGKFLVVK